MPTAPLRAFKKMKSKSASPGTLMLALLALALPLFVFSPAVLGADLTLQGEPVQGGLMKGTAPKAQLVLLDGVPVPQTPSGEFILGFGRNYKSKATLEIILPNKKLVRTLNIAQRIYAVQAIDGIEEKKVVPPPSAWAQIKEEGQMKRLARQMRSATPFVGFSEKFVWPLSGQISGVYGSQRILNGHPKRPHFGIDIAAPAGLEVQAPASGVITLAGGDFYFEGGMIFLDHGLGLTSAFLHLGKILVQVGQKVKQGQVIALSGNSGRTTGAHLDWRIKWRKQNLDPALIVAHSATCVFGAFLLQGEATCYEAKDNSAAGGE